MPFRLVQPRPRFARRPVPREQRIVPEFPVHSVVYRYPHHAGPSGYDRLVDYVGEFVEIGPLRHLAGETILRPFALHDAKRGGVFEYSRYDWVLEEAAMALMKRSRGAVFHFLYGDKSYKRAAKLAGRNGNRMVATIHHPPEHFAELFRSTEHFRRLDRAIVMSAEQKPFLEGIVGAGKVSVVHYGVNTEFFHPPLEGERSPTPLCVFAGFHERDFDLLPSVVRGILSRVPSAEFAMVSKDPRCAEIARTQPRAVVHPRLDDDAYAALLRRAWILVLPLRLSTTTTVALEAMASGLPAVTTEGGIRDYILPDGGTLCPVGDADAMVEAATALLLDPDRLAAAGAKARGQALRFAWHLVARRTVDVYREVLAS